MRRQALLAVLLGITLAISQWLPATAAQVLQSGERAVPPETVVAIRAGRLFDARTGEMLSDQVVLIHRDRITDVGPSVPIPSNATVIDLSASTVLPGMIDAHLHIMPRADWSLPYKTLVGLQHAREDLHGGFTTIVDLSARQTWATIDIRNAINRGVAEGPRMQVAGPEITPRDRSMAPTPPTIDGAGYPDELFVAGPWMARHMVRKLKHYGADWVKIYGTQDFIGDQYQHFKPDGTMVNSPSLTFEEIEAIVDEAHRRGMKVACHAFGGVALADCARAGVDRIEHGNVMTDDVLEMMLEKQITLVFTAENMIDTPAVDLPRSGGQVSRLSLTIDTFKRAMAAGVPIAFGSDMNDEHGTQQKALAYYVKWGMSPAQALQTMFVGAANTLNYGWQDDVGSLEKGKFADVIAVSGDPLSDITEMTRVTFVMKGGVIVKNESAPSSISTTASP